MTKSEKIRALIREDPTLSSRIISEAVGCTKRLVRHVRQEMGPGILTTPKILIYDLETSPMEVYVWGLYRQVIPIKNVKKDWSILSWSAKWLFDDTIMSQVVSSQEAIDRQDASVISRLWELFDEADILIGHNAHSFDVRRANLRFAINGLYPPSPYRVIDTLRHSRKVFGSASFKLDYLNRIFGNKAKLDAPYELWVRSVEGDPDALVQMEEYNKFDVVVTEELYLTLRPWIKGHPNLGLYINTEEKVCTNCGNEDLTWGGHYYTPAGKYKSFRCNQCGAIGRSRLSDLDKEDRARLLLSVAA